MIMEIENGPVPELAVTMVRPSGLSVRPKGWGATTTCRPYGVINLPLGMMVVPYWSISQYWLPAGANAIQDLAS